MASLCGLLVTCCLTLALSVYAGPIPQDFVSDTGHIHMCDTDTCVDRVLHNGFVAIEGDLDYKLKKIVDNPYIQILTVERPIARHARKWHAQKGTLTFQTMEIGLRGVKGTLFAQLIFRKTLTDQECDNVTRTFPCVIMRRSGRTVCRRKLPSIARNGSWTVNVNEPTQLWTGPLQETPTLTPSGQSVLSHADGLIAQGVRFNNEPCGVRFTYDKDNVDNLYGLTVAKIIHETGLHAGCGYVVSSHYNGVLHVKVYAGRTIKKRCITAILSIADSTSQGEPSTAICWNSWMSHNRCLVVDMSIMDYGVTLDSKRCPESTRCNIGQVQQRPSEDGSGVERRKIAPRQEERRKIAPRQVVLRRYVINYPVDALMTSDQNANEQQFQYRS